MNINWYPGHMAKTRREVKELMPLIDIVYELIDARIPFSSKMDDLDDIIRSKKKILVMTKKDLCDEAVTNKWVKYYEKKGYSVLLLDLNNNNDYKKLIKLTNDLCQEMNLKRANKGMKNKEIKALVIGIPNVGKSTLINKIAGRRVANVGNNPGVTKQKNWLKTKYDIVLLDTPGILEPKIKNEIVGLNLAAVSSIKIDVLPINDVGYYIIKTLHEYYPQILENRYGVTNFDDVEEIYQTISLKLGILSKNHEIDYLRINKFIINDIKNEYVKGITLDRGV